MTCKTHTQNAQYPCNVKLLLPEETGSWTLRLLLLRRRLPPRPPS
jgi:hypothetical protein